MTKNSGTDSNDDNKEPFGAVDLGLSVKWATCNIGASTPEEYGDYYAWGETETKEDSSWETYKYGDSDALTKYCTNSDHGTVDNKTVLEPEDDVAHVKLGGSWRMPTDAEWEELLENCTWTKTTNYNGTGVEGRIVTATNGKSIFLPAAGYGGTGPTIDYWNPSGHYWSSTITDAPHIAWSLYFDSAGHLYGDTFARTWLFSVRPVCE